MVEKEIGKDTAVRRKRKAQNTKTVGKVAFYLGVVLVITGLIFLFANWSDPDVISTYWLIYMLVGLGLVFFSQAVKSAKRKKRR